MPTEQRIKLNWIPVTSYKDIPKGIWLVEVESNNLRYQVMDNSRKIATIGSAFAWDYGCVLAYADLGLNEGNDNGTAQ